MRYLQKGLMLGFLSVASPIVVIAQSFQAAPIVNTQHDANDMVSGDFNGDGRPDLAFYDSTNTVSILLGRGDGSFSSAPSFSLQSGVLYSLVTPLLTNVSNLLTADINHDGRPDLVAASEALLTSSLVLSERSTNFVP